MAEEDNPPSESSESITPDISLSRRNPASSMPVSAQAPASPRQEPVAAEDDGLISLSYRSSRPRRAADAEPEVRRPPPAQPMVEVRRSTPRPPEARPTQEVRGRRPPSQQAEDPAPAAPPPRSAPQPRRPAPPEPAAAERQPPRELREVRRARPEPSFNPSIPVDVAQPAVPPRESPRPVPHRVQQPASAASHGDLVHLLRSREAAVTASANLKQWALAVVMMAASAALGLFIANMI